MRKDTTTETKLINVMGMAISVAIQPGDDSGPPLLMINGIGANLEVFEPFLEALDKVGGPKIGTIRFDVPGIGGSPLPPFPLRFPGLARLITEMLDLLGHQQVDVLGVSWGGGLAQQFAYQHSQRCRRLILISTSTGSISVPAKFDVLARMANPRRYTDPSHMNTIASLLYGDEFARNPELASTYAQLLKAPRSLSYYGQVLAGLGWTSIHWLHQLHQPTLILAGQDDVIVPPINARIMARRIPNATLRIFKGGHLFALTEREQVAPLVHSFLRNS